MVRRPGVGSPSLQSNSHALFTRQLTTISDSIETTCSALTVCPCAMDRFGRNEGSPRFIGNILVVCLKMKFDIVGGSGMRKSLHFLRCAFTFPKVASSAGSQSQWWARFEAGLVSARDRSCHWCAVMARQRQTRVSLATKYWRFQSYRGLPGSL